MEKTTWLRSGLYLLLCLILMGFIGFSLDAIRSEQPTVSAVALGSGLLAAILLIAALGYGLINTLSGHAKTLTPIWVLGDDHSDKERLVDLYTDVQLDPSDRPQILPSSLLQNPTANTQGRLRRLWSLLSSPRAPRIVIALNAVNLSATTPTERADLAQRIKTAMMTLHAPYQPANVGIALTLMDKIEGYSEFTEWLIQAEKPLVLDLASSLDDPLSAYKADLSIALTNLSADTFLHLLCFFHNAPNWLAPVVDFTQALQTAPKPQNMHVFFTSSQGTERLISNPFTISALDEPSTL